MWRNYLNRERESQLRGVRELARGFWLFVSFLSEHRGTSIVHQMFLANFQCTMMRYEFIFCVGQLDHCCECEVQPPQNFTLVRNSGAYGMETLSAPFHLCSCGCYFEFWFLSGFDFIPAHHTGCCPKLLCCSEINQEIILVQTCETPREGLKNASQFQSLLLFVVVTE